MRRDVFQAIADPTRREIINRIAGQALNLNSVAENFPISRPAISRHIKILTQCGLIIIKQQGRERYCEANLTSLNQVSEWIDQYRVFWTKQLDALEDFIDKETSAAGKMPAVNRVSVTSKTPAASKTPIAGKTPAGKKRKSSNKSKRK